MLRFVYCHKITLVYRPYYSIFDFLYLINSNSKITVKKAKVLMNVCSKTMQNE